MLEASKNGMGIAYETNNPYEDCSADGGREPTKLQGCWQQLFRGEGAEMSWIDAAVHNMIDQSCFFLVFSFSAKETYRWDGVPTLCVVVGRRRL